MGDYLKPPISTYYYVKLNLDQFKYQVGNYIFALMKTDILQAIFPSIILDNFDIINYQETLSSERIDIYLDEKKIIPEELKDLQVISHGFREAKVIQDFPIRGNAVYLHLRRRKWLCLKDNTIYTKKYDLTFTGTQLTKEFVSFLKDAHREYLTKL